MFFMQNCFFIQVPSTVVYGAHNTYWYRKKFFSCRFGLDTSDGDKNKYLEYSMSSDWDINSCDVEIGILMNEIEVRTFHIMV